LGESCTVQYSGSVNFFELNHHPGTAPTRFHADCDDVRLWIIDKSHGKIPIDVSHQYPWDSRIVTRIVEALCGTFWQPSRMGGCVLRQATKCDVILCWALRIVGVQAPRDTNGKGSTVGSRSRSRRATRLGRWNIIELLGGMWGTWCGMNVRSSITL